MDDRPRERPCRLAKKGRYDLRAHGGAEPTHVGWAREHMTNNCIEDFSIIDAAVGDIPRKRIFLVHRSNERPNPDSWYGQSLIGKLTARGAKLPKRIADERSSRTAPDGAVSLSMSRWRKFCVPIGLLI